VSVVDTQQYRDHRTFYGLRYTIDDRLFVVGRLAIMPTVTLFLGFLKYFLVGTPTRKRRPWDLVDYKPYLRASPRISGCVQTVLKQLSNDRLFGAIKLCDGPTREAAWLMSLAKVKVGLIICHG